MSKVDESTAKRTPLLMIGAAAIASLALSAFAYGSQLEGTLWVLVFVPAAVVAWYTTWFWGAGIVLLATVMPLLGTLPPAAGRVVPDVEVALRGAIAIAAVFLLARAREERLGETSTVRVDPSTGLATSRVLFDQIAVELERAHRYLRPFTIAYVSIDNLPALRQRYGDAAAEETLRRIAHQIKGSLRSVDLVARLRDREFAVLLPETAPDPAKIVLARVDRLLDVSLQQESVPLTFVIGALSWVHSNLGVEAIHQRTYQLMYGARQENVRVNHEVLDEQNLGEVSHQYLTARGGGADATESPIDSRPDPNQP